MNIGNNLIIAILKSEPMSKLINRIPGSHLLVLSLTGSTSRKHVEKLAWQASPRHSTSVLKALNCLVI